MRVGHHARERERRGAIGALARAASDTRARRRRGCSSDRPATGAARRAETRAAEQHVAHDRQLRQPMEQRRLEASARGGLTRGVAEDEAAQPLAARCASRSRPIGAAPVLRDEHERPGRELIDHRAEPRRVMLERVRARRAACSTDRARSDRARRAAARRRRVARGSRRRPCATESPRSGCRGRAAPAARRRSPLGDVHALAVADVDHAMARAGRQLRFDPVGSSITATIRAAARYARQIMTRAA